MGVTAASEVDEVHLTFAFPQSHAIKQVSGSKGALLNFKSLSIVQIMEVHLLLNLLLDQAIMMC